MVLLFPAGLLPAEKIDHAAPLPSAPELGVTAEYGGYLVSVSGCTFCHGPDLSGADSPGAGPSPNLTPGGPLQGWSEADFFNTLRTGVTPGGSQLDLEAMPVESFGKMTDDELGALWLYLQSVPAVTSEGSRFRQ